MSALLVKIIIYAALSMVGTYLLTSILIKLFEVYLGIKLNSTLKKHYGVWHNETDLCYEKLHAIREANLELIVEKGAGILASINRISTHVNDLGKIILAELNPQYRSSRIRYSKKALYREVSKIIIQMTILETFWNVICRPHDLKVLNSHRVYHEINGSFKAIRETLIDYRKVLTLYQT